MVTGKKRWNKLTDDQKKNTYSSYTGIAPEHVDLTGMDYNDLPKDVKKGVKQSQLKAKLLKIKLAESDYETRNRLDKSNSPMSKEVPFGKDKRKKSEIRDDVLDKTISEAKGTKIRPKKPTQADRARIITAKAKVNKLKKKYVDPNPQAETPEEIMQSAEAAGREPTYIAQEHHHKIVFRGHNIGGFKGASLNGQSGKYAKYWLLNAKETNGNGWGIAAHTAKENMKKFIGRPLVVTAQSWHGASEYGDEYEHPYLPTNDINAILNHQEKFRVGSIVDVFEDKHGDWYASIEMLPKFANSRLPPFCSPAIYQLDAAEPEGQISKWEALHLAALTENPAYGARIALLKGTCIGTDNECKVQFKSAKQLIAESPCHDGYEMFGTKSKGGRKVPNCIPAKQAQVTCPIQAKKDKVKSKLSKLKKKQKVSKIKARLAGLGEQNMTYQESKKVKIHKKKHPEVRKAQDDPSRINDILHVNDDGTSNLVSILLDRTPMRERHQPTTLKATFLEPGGKFVNSVGDRHDDTSKTVAEALGITLKGDNLDDDFANEQLQKKTGLIRTQNRINKPLQVDIRGNVTKAQLKTLREFEDTQGIYAAVQNPTTKEQKGYENSKDLTKALREYKYLG